MGVYFDYFRADDDESARSTRSLAGGPLHAEAGGESPYDGVPTKAVFPDPHLEQLLALAAGVPYERGPRTSELLWPPADTPPPADENSPWLTDPTITRLAERVRDGLAAVGADRAAALGAAWAPMLDPRCPVEVATGVITGLGALARRAREAGQQLYCSSTL